MAAGGHALLKIACMALVAGFALLIAPNAFWLARSTVRIENRGSSDVSEVFLEACAQKRALGSLAAGSAIFSTLPKCGDDSLVISAGPHEVCRIYVEAELYHIQSWFSSPTRGDCAYGSPPFWPLLVFQLL